MLPPGGKQAVEEAVQAHFGDWLVASGNIRQVLDLVQLDRARHVRSLEAAAAANAASANANPATGTVANAKDSSSIGATGGSSSGSSGSGAAVVNDAGAAAKAPETPMTSADAKSGFDLDIAALNMSSPPSAGGSSDMKD